jgi:signal transduction histidine kinase
MSHEPQVSKRETELVAAKEKPAAEKRRKFIHIFTISGVVVTILSIPIRLSQDDLIGALVLCGFVANGLFIFYMTRTIRYLRSISYYACILMVAGLAISALTPTADVSPLFGYFSAVLVAYFLLGRRGGVFITGLIVAALLLQLGLRNFGSLEQSYPTVYILIAALMMFTVSLIVYVYDGVNLTYEKLLLEREELLARELKQNKHLAHELEVEKQNVESKVIARTHELHQEQAKLRASIEGLSLGFVLLDKVGSAVIQNAAIRTIFGLESAVLSVSQLQERLVDFDLSQQCRHVFATGRAVEAKGVGMGNKVLHIYLGPVTTAEHGRQHVMGTVVLIQDITEEQVLARSKDEFFSIASHELRTPLTAIRGNASMIMQFHERELKDPDLHDMVYDIHESSTRLIDIVNDFLDVSRLEQGKTTFDFTEVALDEVMETVIYEMRAMLHEKHLALDYNRKTLGELPKVWADKNRLKQVVYNLVGNAAKFTDQGGITLAADQAGQMVKVTVTDTGRGISPEGQRLLFHKFQQAGESLLTRDTTRGTGLGLYISKMLIESMGGRIALESSVEGKGSVFSFTVPLAAGHQTAQAKSRGKSAIDSKTGLSVNPTELAATILTGTEPEAVAPSAAVATPGKLLVVEDDPYVLRLYERIFSSTPIELKTATNGRTGLTLARKFKPDLILLDVMMPVMNGLDTLAKLKANTATKAIPVFMLSNLGEEATVRQAMDRGALAYLLKSDYTPEQIRDKVVERLENLKK